MAKITINKRNLRAILDATKCVFGQNIVVHLKTYMEKENLRCRVTSSDGTLAISGSLEISGDVLKETLSVKFSEFNPFLTNIKVTEFDIEEKENKHVIKAGKASLNIPIAGDDITKNAFWNEIVGIDTKIKIESNKISTFLLKLSDIVTDSPNEALKTIKIENKDKLKIKATDGYRMTIFEMKNKDLDINKECNILIQSNAVMLLNKFAKDDDCITIGSNDKKFVIGIDKKNYKIDLIGALVDHKYPDIEKLLENKPEKIFNINRQKLIQEMKLHMSIDKKDKFNIGKFIFNSNQLKIVSQPTADLTTYMEDKEDYDPACKLSAEFMLKYKYMADAAILYDIFDNNEWLQIGVLDNLIRIEFKKDESKDISLVNILAPMVQ